MRRRTQTLVALMLAGVWGGALGWLHLHGDIELLSRFEAAMTDLRTMMRGERPAPDLVTIVAIDDDTARDAGRYPLPRPKLAELLTRIAALQPRVVAVDLLLVDSGADGSDAALAQALGLRPTAIAAAAIFPQARQVVDAATRDGLQRLPEAERLLMPLPEFAAQAAIGVVNVATDQSGTPRAIPMLFRSGDGIALSLPLQVAALAARSAPLVEPNRLSVGGRSIATDLDHMLPLSFYGRRGSVRTVSAAAVLSGAVPREAIDDRIVMIGATVSGGGDFFPTPFDPVMPGVEVVATAVSHLMTGEGLRRDRTVRIADAVVAVLLPLLLIGLLAWRRNAIGLIATGAVLALWLCVNFIAFAHGVGLSATLALAAAAPPAILFGALQLWSGRARAQQFASRSALFQQFQPPAIRDGLLRDPAFLAEPVQQNASIVFIDLNGFTGLSETLSAEAVRNLLQEFHLLIDDEVTARGGVVTGFLGDGAMMLFGLPRPTADDACNAALCCVDLCRRTEAWLTSLPVPIGFKIGAHSGEVVVSRLGGGSHQHITATGDSVNIASRLMEVAASHGARMAISDDLLREAGADCALHAEARLRGPIQTEIRGRTGLVSMWLCDVGP
jgi:adenylate cyclase